MCRRIVIFIIVFAFCLTVAYAQTELDRHPAQSKGKPVIAITTFENRSSFSENSWVAMSFAESLTTKLKKLTKHLQVVERPKVHEVMKAQGLSIDVIGKSKQRQVELGKLLKADYLVMGSVGIDGIASKPETKLSVTMSTLNLQTEQVKEITVSERQMRDLFDLENDLALRLTSQMGITLTEDEEKLASTKETVSLLVEKYKMDELIKMTTPTGISAPVGKVPIAIITGLNGNVSFQREKDSNWRKATLNLSLYEGDKVKAEEASQATLWLRAGGTLVVKPKEIITVAKQQDKQPEPFFDKLWDTFTRKVNRSQRQKERFDTTLAVRGKIRVEEINALSPRNTKLLSAPVTFGWTEIPDATEYVLTVGYFTGKDKIWQTKVNGTSFSLESVSIPGFVSGKPYLWEVEAYDNEGRFITSDSAWFAILTERERGTVNYSIGLIGESASDDEMTKCLLLAAFYEENELYLESERLLKEMLVKNDHPKLHLMLADLYIRLGLSNQSWDEFKEGDEVSAEIE